MRRSMMRDIAAWTMASKMKVTGEVIYTSDIRLPERS
jgi:hypothetical protein